MSFANDFGHYPAKRSLTHITEHSLIREKLSFTGSFFMPARRKYVASSRSVRVVSRKYVGASRSVRLVSRKYVGASRSVRLVTHYSRFGVSTSSTTETSDS